MRSCRFTSTNEPIDESSTNMSTPCARGQDEHRRGAVEDVAGRHLLRAGLQDGRDRIGDRRLVAEDREDRADADRDVEVRRAVERIEDHAVLSALAAAAENRRLLVLLRGDDGDGAAVAEARHQDVVGDDVELLLRLAVDVGAAVVAEHVFDPGVAHLGGDRLGGERDRREDPRQVARGGGIAGFFVEDV